MSEETNKGKRIGKDLTSGPVFPLLISFAVPMILASLIQQLYGMVDLMIIGKYVGSVGTVGVSTGGELSDVMTPIASAFATAGQIYIAQMAGAKLQDRIRSAVGTLLTLMMITAVVATVGAVLFYKVILGWLNCPAEAWDSAAQYMLITAIGMPFIFGYNGICAILRGMGEAKRPLIFVAVAATINIFLDLLLVVVFHLDAAGTAIATVASQIGAFAASFIYFYRRREQVGFQLKLSYFKMNGHDLGVILRLGIPQMVRVVSVQGSMLWVKSSINAFGLVTSSTYSIGNKIEKFMSIFTYGVDGAGGAIMGQSIGARKYDRVGEVMRKILLLSMGTAVIVAVLFLTVPDTFYGLFTSEAEVIEFGRTFLRIMAVGALVAAFSGCGKTIATGAGAAALSLATGVLDGITRIGVCLFCVYLLKMGSTSYFWGAAFCQLIPGLICYVYYFSGKWKTKKLL